VDDLLDFLLGRADDLDLAIELAGEQLDGLVGEGLRKRRHLAELHELLDEVGAGDTQRLSDLADGRPGVDLERRLLLLDRGRLLLRLLQQRPAPATSTPPRRA